MSVHDVVHRSLGWIVLVTGLAIGLYYAFWAAQGQGSLSLDLLLGGPAAFFLAGTAVALGARSIGRALILTSLFLLALPGVLALWTFLRVPPPREYLGLSEEVRLAYDTATVAIFLTGLGWFFRPSKGMRHLIVAEIFAGTILGLAVLSGSIVAVAGQPAFGSGLRVLVVILIKFALFPFAFALISISPTAVEAHP